MIPFNLRQRLLVLSLLPSALLAIVLVTYFTVSGIRALEGELRQRGLAVVSYLAPVSEYGVIAGQLENLQGLAQATIQQSGVKAAVVVGQGGKPLAVSGRVSLSSDDLKKVLESPGPVAESDSWIAFAAPIRRSLADADVLFDPAGSRAAPETIGQIFVEFDKNDLISQQNQLLRRGILIILGGLLLVAMLAIAIADTLTRPVHRLLEAVRAMTHGHFETRVKEYTTIGEVAELERGFNDMAERIEEVHQTMQQRIEEATAQLAFQARHDPLTGLVNRREFEARLEKAISVVQAGGAESSVLFIDLDRFKPVNDTCGHLAGDELLRQISRLFQGRLREEDTLARIGGDEFAVLLCNCVGSRAVQVAQDLCGLASAYRFIWQDKVLSIGASIGLTPINREVRSVVEAIGAGDAACYAAKDEGRNRVHVQEATTPTNRRQDSHPWQERITKAFTTGQLLADAMPLMALDDRKEPIQFAEVCPRLDDHMLPAISSTVLMDAAERYDLAATIDQHIIGITLHGLARAMAHSRNMRCLLPLSSTSVRNRNTLKILGEMIKSDRLQGSNLYFQLTEDTAVQFGTQAIELTHGLRRLGCHIVLSDFGGGFASFSHLRSIHPDAVKISRSLTRDLATSRSSLALLRAIQEIAVDLGIDTIAEGVNDSATVKLMADLGITWAQGDALAPSEPFENWLEGAVIRGS